MYEHSASESTASGPLDDAVLYSEEDLAQIASELAEQMPEGLAPAVMGKLGYCLVMIALLNSWAALVFLFPEVGTVVLITGRGPGLGDFHKLASRIGAKIRDGFPPAVDDDRG